MGFNSGFKGLNIIGIELTDRPVSALIFRVKQTKKMAGISCVLITIVGRTYLYVVGNEYARG